jgi:hypothetical protein
VVNSNIHYRYAPDALYIKFQDEMALLGETKFLIRITHKVDVPQTVRILITELSLPSPGTQRWASKTPMTESTCFTLLLESKTKQEPSKWARNYEISLQD